MGANDSKPKTPEASGRPLPIPRPHPLRSTSFTSGPPVALPSSNPSRHGGSSNTLQFATEAVPEPPWKPPAHNYGAGEKAKKVADRSDVIREGLETESTSLEHKYKDNWRSPNQDGMKQYVQEHVPRTLNQPKNLPDLSAVTDSELVIKHRRPSSSTISEEYVDMEDVPSLTDTKNEQCYVDLHDQEKPVTRGSTSSFRYKRSTEKMNCTEGIQNSVAIRESSVTSKKVIEENKLPITTLLTKLQENSSIQQDPLNMGNSGVNFQLDEDMLAGLCPIYSIEGKKIVTLSSKSEHKEQNVLHDCLVALSILYRILVTFPAAVKISELESFGEALDPNMKRVLELYSGTWSEKLTSLISRFPVVFRLDNGLVKRWEGGLNWLNISMSDLIHIVVCNLLQSDQSNLDDICMHLRVTCNVTHLPNGAELSPISLQNFFERQKNPKSQFILKDARFAILSEKDRKAKEVKKYVKADVKQDAISSCAKCSEIESCEILCIGEIVQVTSKGTIIWWYSKHQNPRKINTLVYATEKGIVMDSNTTPITDALKKGDMVTFSPFLFHIEGQMKWLARHVHICSKASALKPDDECPARSSAQTVVQNFRRNKMTVVLDCCGIVVKTGKTSAAIWFPGSEEIPYSLFAEVKEGESWIVGGSTSPIDEVLICGQRVVFDLMTSKSWTGCMIWVAKCVRQFDSVPIITGSFVQLLIDIVQYKNAKSERKLMLIGLNDGIVAQLNTKIQRCEKPYWDKRKKACEGSVVWNEIGGISSSSPKFFRIIANDGETISAHVSPNCWNPDAMNFYQMGKKYLFCAECHIDDEGTPKWIARLVRKPLNSANPSPAPLTVGIPKPTAAIHPSKTSAVERSANIETLLANPLNITDGAAIVAQVNNDQRTHKQNGKTSGGVSICKSRREAKLLRELFNANEKFKSVECQTLSTGGICSFNLFCE